MPVYHTLYHVLTNPVWTLAPTPYGRRGTRVTLEGGRKRIIRDNLRRDWRQWEVLIHDHHEGYISWAGVREEPTPDRRQCQWKEL